MQYAIKLRFFFFFLVFWQNIRLDGVDKGVSISIASSPKLGEGDMMQTHSDQTVTTPTKQQEQPPAHEHDSELNSPTTTQPPQVASNWLSCFSCSCCR